MKKIFILFVVALLGAVYPAYSETGVGTGEGFETQAVLAADEWLRLLDQQDYKQCWTKAAAYFREQVTEDQWVAGMKSIESLIGPAQARTMRSSNYFRAMANAPMGEYVVIVYDVTLKNGQSAVETVTPMKDQDGQWRVSGYYVKPGVF